MKLIGLEERKTEMLQSLAMDGSAPDNAKPSINPEMYPLRLKASQATMAIGAKKTYSKMAIAKK